ncbi:MAG: hypothetical protein HYV90_04430 [Candidatus Woesebacteria bacterium]|nr:MAG: hypothetical protein HYV90_04430 [Candidatus Woesebacteria bacterium]
MTKTYIGQHFLTNEVILEKIAGFVPKNSTILEIGAGEGQLTRKLARHASQIETVEIDKDLLPTLYLLLRSNKNLKITIENALTLDFQKYPNYWLVGNIPYHITEPLVMKLADTNFKSIILMVGDSFGREATAIPDNMENFGKLSWIIYAYFRAKIELEVGKENFDPVPRTDSSVLVLTPRNPDEFKDGKLFLMRWLVRSIKGNKLIKNALMEGIIRLKKSTKNQAKEIISNTELSPLLLSKPFEQLNNEEYRKLYQSLDIVLKLLK